jgi:competence protein ComEC
MTRARTDGPDGVTALDLRLVPAALAVWACAALGRELPPDVLLRLAAPPLLIGVVVAWAGLRGVNPLGSRPRGTVRRRDARRAAGTPTVVTDGRPGRQPPAAPYLGAAAPGRARVLPVVITLIVCGAASACDTALRRIALVSGPVPALASRGARVDAHVTVTDDPHPAATAPAATPAARPLTVVPARLSELTSGGERIRQHLDVLLLAAGGGWDGVLPSQRVRVIGRLASAKPGDTVAAVVLVRGPPTLVGRPSPAQRLAGHIRRRLRQAAAGSPGGLLPGLVIGDTRDVSPVVDADFRAAGMTHLLAVSGANLMIVLDAVLTALRRGRAPRRVRAFAAALTLVGFVVVARPSPSVLRAGAMALLGVLALAAGRPRAALPVFAASVGGLLLAQPDLAISPGFALSTCATAGLLLLAPGWARSIASRMPRSLEPLAEPLAVACAAFVTCLPVVTALAGRISLVSVPANICAEIAVAPVTVLGVLAAAIATGSVGLARVPALVAGVGCRWLIAVAGAAARVPGGQLSWPAGGVGLVSAFALVAACAAVGRRRRGRRLLAGVAVIAVCGHGLIAAHAPGLVAASDPVAYQPRGTMIDRPALGAGRSAPSRPP